MIVPPLSALVSVSVRLLFISVLITNLFTFSAMDSTLSLRSSVTVPDTESVVPSVTFSSSFTVPFSLSLIASCRSPYFFVTLPTVPSAINSDTPVTVTLISKFSWLALDTVISM